MVSANGNGSGGGDGDEDFASPDEEGRVDGECVSEDGGDDDDFLVTGEAGGR